jgi:hypothetical protein
VTQASLLLPPSLHTFTCIFHMSHLHIGLQSSAQLHTCIPNWTRPEVLGSFIHTQYHTIKAYIHRHAEEDALKRHKKRCTCYIWSNRSCSEVLSHGFQMPWPPLAFDYPLVLTLDIWHSLTPLICHDYATILYHFRPSFRTLNMLTFWLFRMTFEMTIPYHHDLWWSLHWRHEELLSELRSKASQQTLQMAVSSAWEEPVCVRLSCIVITWT